MKKLVTDPAPYNLTSATDKNQYTVILICVLKDKKEASSLGKIGDSPLYSVVTVESIMQIFYLLRSVFHSLGSLGRVSLVVAMSVSCMLYLRPLAMQFFSRPLIGQHRSHDHILVPYYLHILVRYNRHLLVGYNRHIHVVNKHHILGR